MGASEGDHMMQSRRAVANTDYGMSDMDQELDSEGNVKEKRMDAKARRGRSAECQ